MDPGGIEQAPNDLLYSARIRRLSPSGSGRPMSRQELADQVNAYLYGSERGLLSSGVDAKYIGKLERGRYRWPNELYRQAFRHVLKASSDAEIGFFILRPPRKQLTVLPAPLQPPALADPVDTADGTDWPMWFGMKLAHALSTVQRLTGEHTEALQTLLHQEILMFDASAPSGPTSGFDPARRQTLITLATLPLTIGIGLPTGVPDGGAATETFLAHCGASLTACWHLLNGSDLDVVDRLLNSYLMPLELIARTPSKHQQTAARLASQAHHAGSIIAFHRGRVRAREHHCKQALDYATAAADMPGQVSALLTLGSTYFDDDPARATQIHERALTLDADISPLLQSRARAYLAVAYGRLGRDRQALAMVDLAEQLYPEQPEHDPSYLYGECTKAWLTMKRGHAFAELAQHYPQRGYAQTAGDVFSRMEQSPPASVPVRIKYQIINSQASTAVLTSDLDAFAGYLRQGAEGAALLGSKQRTKEIQDAWQLATTAWPHEPRLKALGRDLMPAITSS